MRRVTAAERIAVLAQTESQPLESTIRIARYTGYPRVSRNQRECTAIAHKTPNTLLSLIAAEGEAVGALLRLNVNDLCGPPERETLARVVACTPRDDGRFEVRVEPVEPNRPRFVRRPVDRPELLLEG
jgi:hypothetical protein